MTAKGGSKKQMEVMQYGREVHKRWPQSQIQEAKLIGKFGMSHYVNLSQ